MSLYVVNYTLQQFKNSVGELNQSAPQAGNYMKAYKYFK